MKRPRRAILIGVAAAGLLAAVVLPLDPRALVSGTPDLLFRFLGAALHPTLVSHGTGGSLAPQLAGAVRTTLAFAAAGLSLAILVGFPLGFLASSVWWEGDATGGERRTVTWLRRRIAPAVTAGVRLLIGGMRSIHELLWAMLFLAAIGLSPASAVLAIAIPYAGTLAKVFSEMLDEAPRDAALTLRAAGARPGQVFVLGLLPRALPDMAGYTFYRFECAVRSSAILGFFGFPTLGYFVSASFENLYYDEVWTYLYALFAIVILLDFWSGRLRKRSFA